MNKEELYKEIGNLPLFEKRDIKVKHHDNEEFVNTKHYQAICEIDGEEPYAVVTKGYQVVQFKDVFRPILDSIPENLNGNLVTYGGFARLTVFPENTTLKDGDNQYGLIAINSVDQSSSVVVKFCVSRGDHRITIPAKIAGFRKAHTKNVGNVAKNYISMVGKVKEVWDKIVTEFPKYSIKTEVSDSDDNCLELGEVAKHLKLGERMTKHLKKRVENSEINGKPLTLWDLFEAIITKMEFKKYKSDVHQGRNIDKISEAVFDYATVLQI